MSHSITFALLSLVFAGANDFVFKLYSAEDRSRGMYVFGIGVTWTLLQVVGFAAKGVPIVYDMTTIKFGLLAGLILALSNTLFIESLTHIDVSLGSMIYRLNTIGVIILSFFFLHELFGTLKSLGIVIGVVSVLLLYQKGPGSPFSGIYVLFFGVAVVASMLRAAYGVIAKAGLLQNADPNTMLLLMSSSWIVGGACYSILKEKRFRITKKKVAYSVLSGFLVFLIANFLMLAIEYGEASIVIPIANMGFIVALSLSVLMKVEVLTRQKLYAAGCAAGSIILLSRA